jgi:hypothetical protein
VPGNPEDAIPFLDRLSNTVVLPIWRDLLDHTHTLMPQDYGNRHLNLSSVAVGIRPADSRDKCFHQYAAFFKLGNVKFLDL